MNPLRIALFALPLVVLAVAPGGCSNAPPRQVFVVVLEPEFATDEQAQVFSAVNKWVPTVEAKDMALYATIEDCAAHKAQRGETTVCVRRYQQDPPALLGEKIGNLGGETVLLNAASTTDHAKNLMIMNHTMQHELGHVFGLGHLGAGTVMYGWVFPDYVQGDGYRHEACESSSTCDAGAQDVSEGDIAEFNRIWASGHPAL